MFNQIISICLLVTLFISVSSGQSCSSTHEYPFECVEEGMECNQNKTCEYGTSCLLNQLFKNNIPPSILADIGGNSFEPIPQYICQKPGEIGESCIGDEYCMEYLTCFNAYGEDDNQTCQLLFYAQVGYDCSYDEECYRKLKCDPYEKKCVPDLSLSSIQQGYQCTSNVHCSYGYQCNTTQHLCVPKAALGEQCGDNIPGGSGTRQCVEDTLCVQTDQINGYSYCITPFSLKENDVCSTDFQFLAGYGGVYVSPCGQGLLCNGSNCEKPTWTASSVNCSDSSNYCNSYETCYCNNGTSTPGVTGQCFPDLVTDSDVQSECIELTQDLIECAKDNKCTDFAFYLRYTISDFLPGSCIREHCGSTICEIQEKCTRVVTNQAPTCGDPSLSETGICAQFGSASSVAFSASLILLVISSVLLF